MINEASSGLDEPLPLSTPKSHKRDVSQGFWGIVVNLISMLSSCKTKNGHGFGETLFYLCRFRRIYGDRLFMMMACSCFTGGAISLDGGVVRGNGLRSIDDWKSSLARHIGKICKMRLQTETRELRTVC